MAKKNLREEINISDRYARHLVSGRVTATAGIRNPHTLNMIYGPGSDRIEVLRALETKNKFRLIWYVIFLALGVVCFALEPKSWFQCLDLVVLMVNIDLVSEGKLIGIYIGIIECFMYAYICFISGLYGEVIKMFIINIPLNIFALVSWMKNLRAQKKANYKEKSEDKSVVVRKIPVKHYWWLALVLVAIYFGCYFGLKLLNTSAIWFSAGVLAFTIYQKVLSGLCYKENWWFQILANAISIGMWLEVIITSSSAGIDLMELAPLVGTVASLVNGFYGYALWKSMYRRVTINGGELLFKRKVKINSIIKLRRKYQTLIWNKDIDVSKNS